jgi:hypothetical protein
MQTSTAALDRATGTGPGRPPILVFGSARSGTTWIARILDTHPDTLYRHEPDAVRRGEGLLPFTFAPGEVDKYLPAARAYVHELLGVRAAKSNSFLPQFHKSYRGPVAHGLRRLFIYAHKGAESILQGVGLDRSMRIPDLARMTKDVVPVMKSVDSLGRAPLMARALGDCRVVLIVRHPCGMVSSKLRGFEAGKMAKPVAYRNWLKLGPAKARGLTAQALQALSPTQAVAYEWLLFNEYILEEMAGDPRLRVVVYDDFCRDPHAAARDLLGWAGLEYAQATSDFIERSLSYAGPPPRYFDIVRNPLEAAMRWQRELDDGQKQDIADVIRGSRAGRLFFGDATR